MVSSTFHQIQNNFSSWNVLYAVLFEKQYIKSRTFNDKNRWIIKKVMVLKKLLPHLATRGTYSPGDWRCDEAWREQTLVCRPVMCQQRFIYCTWELNVMKMASLDLDFSKHTLGIIQPLWHHWHWNRTECRFAPSQWETPLQSKAVSHWLGANLESAVRNMSYTIWFWYALLCYDYIIAILWVHNGRYGLITQILKGSDLSSVVTVL